MKMRQHNIFFFYCRITWLVWASVYAAWGLPKLSSVSNIFGNWLNSIRKDCKPSVLVGAAAFCWSVWRCRNAVVFDNKKNSFLQVIFATTHWLRTWLSYNGPLRRTSFWRRRIFDPGGQGLFCPSAWVAV